MPKHAHTVEQIISKLREAEVLISQGQTIPAAAKALLARLVSQTDKLVSMGQLPSGRADCSMQKPLMTRSAAYPVRCLAASEHSALLLSGQRNQRAFEGDSKGNMRFQSLFMSTTIHPLAAASSRPLSSRPVAAVRS